jgi:hypothetical protein
MARGADPLAAVAALPGVAQAVARARVAVDAARAHPVLRRRGPEVAAESALRGARASAALEGAVIDLPTLREAVRRGAVGRARADFPPNAGADDPVIPGADDSVIPGADAPVILGAVRVSAELATLAPTWRRAPLQVLARLHVLAAADLLESNRLGRPRGPSDPAPRLAGPAGPGASLPEPSAAEAVQRLDQLVRLLVAPSRAPALVVAAIAHGELLAIRAFAAGNGVLARAVSRLVLITGGLDPASVTVPEVGHLHMGHQAYADALCGYAGGTAAGVAGWVVHCGAALAGGARETEAFCDGIRAAPRPG